MAHQEKDTPLVEEEGKDYTKLKQAIEAHLSVTIAGSNIFQLGEEQTYGLTVTLHYHGSDGLASSSGALPSVLNELPPLTFKKDWSPVSQLSSMTGLYRLHPVSPPDAEPVKFYEADFELLDEPKAVNTKNGFMCLHPNESVTRKVLFMTACCDVRPDARYKIKMMLNHAVIQWWDIGEIEKFIDVKVRCTEISKNGSLSIRSSNEIEVLTVVKTHGASEPSYILSFESSPISWDPA